jgi:hypothetical protein
MPGHATPLITHPTISRRPIMAGCCRERDNEILGRIAYDIAARRSGLPCSRLAQLPLPTYLTYGGMYREDRARLAADPAAFAVEANDF